MNITYKYVHNSITQFVIENLLKQTMEEKLIIPTTKIMSSILSKYYGSKINGEILVPNIMVVIII